MTEFKGLYDIRDVRAGDKSFILATFLRGVYHGSSWFKLIPQDVFFANYKAVGESLVNNPNLIISVACLKEEPDVILGYSIVSKDFQVINWCYVKKIWRLKGIAKSLLPQHPNSISHLSDLGKTLLPKINNPIFNPFKSN